jgi:tRNA A37 threonylcarbamoyladenosine dehydratase
MDFTNDILILDLSKTKHRKLFEYLKKKNIKIVDTIESQLRELFYIKNPPALIKKRTPKLKKKIKTLWVYYPWHNALVHVLNENDFYLVKTSRNQNLITKSEQKILKKARIGLVGLNVGNPIALSLVFQGFTNFKIADNDILELSNLNRLASGLRLIDLGESKAVLTKRQILDINPFCKIDCFTDGINEKNIIEFLIKPRIDILVEEMDNLLMKIKIRELSKNFRIPVIMATGNGPNVIIDIERYDLDPNIPILNGYLKDKVINKIRTLNNLTFTERIQLAKDFMQSKYLTKRLKESFSLIGKKLAGIPQIADVSFLRAGVMNFFIRKILLDKKISSGRYFLNIEELKYNKSIRIKKL